MRSPSIPTTPAKKSMQPQSTPASSTPTSSSTTEPSAASRTGAPSTRWFITAGAGGSIMSIWDFAAGREEGVVWEIEGEVV